MINWEDLLNEEDIKAVIENNKEIVSGKEDLIELNILEKFNCVPLQKLRILIITDNDYSFETSFENGELKFNKFEWNEEGILILPFSFSKIKKKMSIFSNLWKPFWILLIIKLTKLFSNLVIMTWGSKSCYIGSSTYIKKKTEILFLENTYPILEEFSELYKKDFILANLHLKLHLVRSVFVS